MQSMMPLLQKQMAAMQERVQEEVIAMLKESDPHSKTTQKPSKN